ncbi:hypothetical protein [Modestobacter versicolor]|uniref:Uncharacterized protein n=1 Tax=Modestobacter versicolor TaxID=429133 RepID=A0A323V6Q1_9ACTN|nr:hypothetical protein [Modestobacter versicolor]MBB3675072.1 hypothetical protein [Modestobacter versicolor]PZA20485.1 hypothetical protein DMO24_15255 [Modestobacter versicolor]
MLSTAVVLPGGTPDVPGPATVGAALPVVPEPVTDGCGDRLVVVSATATPDRPSATLLAAQQLSDEADRRPRRVRGLDTSAGDRRLRRQRALLAERRAERSHCPGT